MRLAHWARPVSLFIYDADGADAFFQKRYRFTSLPNHTPLSPFSPSLRLAVTQYTSSFRFTAFDPVAAFRHVIPQRSPIVFFDSSREDILTRTQRTEMLLDVARSTLNAHKLCDWAFKINKIFLIETTVPQ